MHTPGQWKIRAGYGKLMSEIGPEDRAVCTVWTKQPKYNQVTERSEPAAWAEGEANAALIAAAPDLLTALEIALPYVESFDGDNADLQTKANAEAVRAAIAKAKGEKS
jgi:hypothetical protein